MEIYKDISESSKKLYTHNLKKLNKGTEVTSLNFLKKKDDILSQLESMNPNTKRTYLIAVVSAVKQSDNKAVKKLYEFYYPLLQTINTELRDNTKKTTKEEENWITVEDLTTITDKCDLIVGELKNKKKITDDQYERLLDCLILSLYTKIPPRRSLDYIEMVTAYPEENKTTNYLFDNTFYINRYKTAKTYQQQVIDIPANLQAIIKLYLKHKKGDNDKFLINKKGVAFKSSTDMTVRLNKIFDKKISVSMLRKLYLSSKYGDTMKDMQKDAEAMATSVGTIQTNYIKK